MYRLLPLLGIMLLLFPLYNLRAETIVVDRNLSLRFDLPGGKWQLTREAPSFLVDETIEHLRHEMSEKNQSVPPEKVREAALRRLAANEAYLCQAESGACLVIDFSPLRAGEDPPSAKSVRHSAKYAAEGLEEEEGISGVKHTVREVRFPGASFAQRIDASYRQHGEGRKFTGIVGFAHSHWFYLYYTDPLQSPADAYAMDAVLKSAALVRGVRPDTK